MGKVIKIEHLSKAYQLGEIGTGTLSRDLERSWAKIRGKEDPFLKIGEVNDRTIKGTSDVAWALRDINFEVEQGEAIGIIGRNGAGKSTLLKILSRVTAPSTGSVKVKGRIASLLEVGTGFHPELSGKENIYLNGAILGMRKTEIKRKFDEIVDFSGVERYIDTPVKRYSSGMYVRLAFAVAAHLESEILIVDEVLAVGDAEFQKKCLGRMKDVSVNGGRTVLFVSHNLSALQKLCNKSILLKNGILALVSDTPTVIDNYIAGSEKAPLKTELLTSDHIDISLNILNQHSVVTNDVQCGQRMTFSIQVLPKRRISSLRLVMSIFNMHEQRLMDFDTWYQMEGRRDVADKSKYLIQWGKNILRPGTYAIRLGIYENDIYLTGWEHVDTFRVLESDYYSTGRLPNSGQGPILTDVTWTIE